MMKKKIKKLETRFGVCVLICALMCLSILIGTVGVHYCNVTGVAYTICSATTSLGYSLFTLLAFVFTAGVGWVIDCCKDILQQYEKAYCESQRQLMDVQEDLEIAQKQIAELEEKEIIPFKALSPKRNTKSC